MQTEDVLRELRSFANPKNVRGMARFGINTKNTLGVPVVVLRRIAKKIGRDHDLALQLWESGVHEARILASMIDHPKLVTEKQLESWVKDFDSWDVCDQACSNLFDKTKFAWDKAVEWTKRDEEFVRRAGYVLMACLAVHNGEAKDEDFIKLFPVIKKGSVDERNFVKKAVNWSIRQIGKRNRNLNKKAIALAEEIQKTDSKAAKWIAWNALQELKNQKIQKRLKR
jgi:3-methyladenine DNA glycosylase AlkD